MRKISVLLAVLFLVLFCLVHTWADVQDTKEVKEACECPVSLGKAPNFSLKNTDGGLVKLSDFAGKSVILFFWATWCPRCREDMPDLNKMQPLLKEKGAEFLGISVGETGKKVQRFVKNQPIDFPILLDIDQSVSQSYVVVGVPTFIIISKSGSIVFQNHFWPHDYEELFSCE